MRRQVEKNSTRAEFARRLQRAIVLKGWTQTELANKAQAKAPEGMRIGKDSISHYTNGRYMPSPQHLQVLADTLGVDVADLLPPRGASVMEESLPPINIQDLNDGTAWVKINQAIPWPKAVKIMEILRGE